MDQFGQHRCGDDGSAHDLGGLCVSRFVSRSIGAAGPTLSEFTVVQRVSSAIDAVGVGKHVDQRGAGTGILRPGSSGAERIVAGTRQPVGAGGQGGKGVGAALSHGARVVVADAVGHRGQPPIEDGGVVGIQPPPQWGRTRFGVVGVDNEVAAAGRGLTTPHRGPIVGFDDRVDGRDGFGRRQLAVIAGLTGQGRIDTRQHAEILDQCGVPDDGAHHRRTERAVGEQPGDPR